MKLQLFVIGAILVTAFALPVPDEEVSPVQSVSAPVVQPDVVAKPVEEKPVEVVKPESRAAAELPLAKPTEELKIELPASVPDAELPQTLPLPEKKDELIKPADKQIRAENVIPEVKALPVLITPVAAVEEQKQVAEEVQPIVQEVVQAEGKSITEETLGSDTKAAVAAPASSTADVPIVPAAPALKAEIPAQNTLDAAPIAQSEEPLEAASRKERVSVDNVQKIESPVVKSKPIQEDAPVVAAVADTTPDNSLTKTVPEVSETAPLPVEAAKPDTAPLPLEAGKTIIEEPVALPTQGVIAEEKAAVPTPREAVPSVQEAVALPATEVKENIAAIAPEQGNAAAVALATPDQPISSKPRDNTERADAPAPVAIAQPEVAVAQPEIAAASPKQIYEKDIKPAPLVPEASSISEPEKIAEESPASNESKKSEESKESKESKESEESKESDESSSN